MIVSTRTDIAYTESKAMEDFFTVNRLNHVNTYGVKFLNELKTFDNNDATNIDSSSSLRNTYARTILP